MILKPMRTMIMEKLKNNNKVLLGLSGGVDSTAAALLLAQKGLDVTGYHFDVTGSNQQGLKEAQRLADKLGIELIYEDVSAEFEQKIIDNFCSEYINGRTPNPCVLCNPQIKFRKLLQKADEIGAYYIATGHYCRIYFDEKTGFFYPRMGASQKKDQSYMLYRLGQDVLSRLIFPLGDFEDKDKVRQIARSFGMENAEKKDSQEICFLGDSEDHTRFMAERGIKCPAGNFVDENGNILGRHRGIANYTVGQRKGLGIALGKPAYVIRIDRQHNTVVLGDNGQLFHDRVVCSEPFFTGLAAEAFEGRKLRAKVRYAAKPEDAFIEVACADDCNGRQYDLSKYVCDKKIIATFDKPQRAPAPGQSIVFYDGDIVVGGGFIV